MVVEIRPDPKHPRGGFAEVTLAGAVATSDPVMVSVYNSYQQKWLGLSGWQPNKSEFPARSAVQDGDVLRLIMGPDVVNQIEEDTPIRIEIDGTGWDTYWPDDVNAGPDEAIVGEIGGTGVLPNAKGPTAATVMPREDAAQEVLSDTDRTADDAGQIAHGEAKDALDVEEDANKRSRTPLVLGGLGLLLVAAGAIYFLALGPDTKPTEIAKPAPKQELTAVQEPDTCRMEALSALQGDGFSVIADQIRACGGKVSADDALRLVEQAAGANDPDALDLFGALYDNAVTDDAIEGTIGLTFADAPARAAEYYARAIGAGSQNATERMQAVCRRLLLMTDTLSASARDDYCK